VMIAVGLAIASFVIPVIASLLISLAGILIPVIAVIAAVALLRTAWEENWGGIQEKTAAVWAFIQAMIPVAMTYVQGIVDQGLAAIAVFWETYGAQITSIATSLFNGVSNIITAFVGVFLAIITVLWETVLHIWQNYGDRIMAWGSFIWETTLSVLEGFAMVFEGITEAFLSAITGDWEGFKNALFLIVDGLWKAISNMFMAGGATIITTAGIIISELLAAWNNVDWGTMGMSVVNGIINGLTGGLGRVVAAAAGLAASALSAAMGALDANSPSKEFYKLGTYSVDGMVLGLNAGIPTIENASASVAMAAMPDISPTSTTAAIGGRGGASVVFEQGAIMIDLRGAERGMESEIERMIQREFSRLAEQIDARSRA
jgi:hypothetical protein